MNKHHLLAAFAFVALLALVATPLAAAEAPAEAPATPEVAEETAPAAEACAAPALDALEDVDGPEPTRLACSCRDQCQTDSDCSFYSQFVCDGEPASCVMANSCCNECVCLATS